MVETTYGIPAGKNIVNNPELYKELPLINLFKGMEEITFYKNGKKINDLREIEDYILHLCEFPLAHMFPQKILNEKVSGSEKQLSFSEITIKNKKDIDRYAHILEEKMGKYIKMRMKNSVIAEGFFETMEDLSDLFGTSDDFNILDENNYGAFGNFFETNIMGLGAGSSPKSDFLSDTDMMVELKTTARTTTDKISVGDIAVSYNNTNGLNQDEFDRIMVAFKMAQKMRNLLYVKLGSPKRHGKKYRSKFLEFTLYMFLSFQRLYNSLLTQSDRAKVGISVTKSFGADVIESISKNVTLLKRNYKISLSLTKIKGEYKWEHLYLRKLDILERIKEDRDFANRWFGELRKDNNSEFYKFDPRKD